MTPLKSIECFLLDMDGTIYLGGGLIDGAAEFLRALEKNNIRRIFLTNNSSKNRESYVKKLAGLQIDATPDDIFSSGEAAAMYLSRICPGGRIFLLGTPDMEQVMENAGYTLVRGRNEQPDAVLLAFDTTLTYNKLWTACDYITGGVPYFATHPDFVCPLPGGCVMPDAGAIAAMISASTGGKMPVVIGKPEKIMADMLCKKYGLNTETLAMVGDRLYTDIAMGEKCGITSVLVLSGETTKEEYENQREFHTDYVFPSVKELKTAIEESL